MSALRWPGEVAGTVALFLVDHLPDPVRAVAAEHPIGPSPTADPLIAAYEHERIGVTGAA